MDINNYIKSLLQANPRTKAELTAWKRRFAKGKADPFLSDSAILKAYRQILAAGEIASNPQLERVLRKRAVRTMSGIAPVAVLTMPFPCPGKCVFCPSEKTVPKSYLSNEPAVMRAIRCGYEPYLQVQHRLQALIANGHEPTKIELIVIGGTWSVLPVKYKYWYVWQCFRAANRFAQSSIINYQLPIKEKLKIKNYKIYSLAELKRELLKEQKKNEKAKYRIIGVTLETRPDYIDEKELIEMRELGGTRVELGVQTVFDDILKLNRRGHGVAEIAAATALLRQFGFKITYHLMPGLPGSTPARDLAMFRTLFSDERFQPDQIKFYPTVVTKGSLLYRWWKQGKYKPYTDKQLEKLIIACKRIVPPYVRIIRLIRDIPGESIMAGNLITNLRQVLQQKGVVCRCIRCREAKEQLRITNYELRIIKYRASGGEEFFISYESEDGKTLYGFCRLWLPGGDNQLKIKNYRIKNLTNAAFVRELHVYGELVPVGQEKKIQHAGLGRKLLAEAERIARENGYQRLAIISGVGVRGYYRRLGYRLRETYMVKFQILKNKKF